MQKIKFILIHSFLILQSVKANAQADQLLDKAWIIFETNLDSAIALTRDAYKVAQANMDLKNTARAISYRAIFYDIEGKADSSLLLFNKAITIQEAINDNVGLQVSNINLGIFHFTRGHSSQAEKYFQVAYEKAMLLNDFKSAAKALVNLGLIEADKKGENKALEYYDEAEKLFIAVGDSISLWQVWSNYAIVYYMRGDYPEALIRITKSINYNDELKPLHQRLTDRIIITDILISLKRYDEALKYALEALALSQESDNPERIQYVYNVVAKVYYHKNEFKKAYEYNRRYMDLKDSLVTDYMTDQIAGLEAQYGIEKKNNEISQLKLEAEQNEVTRLKKEKTQNTLYFILTAAGLGVVILIVLVFLLRNNLKLEKANGNLLTEKKQQAEILLDKEKLLMRESHHRIKNNLQLVNSILALQSRNIKDPKVKIAFTESIQRIQTISFAHQRLFGNETVEKLNVKEFLSDLINSIETSLLDSSSEIKIIAEINELVLSTEQAIPIGLLVNELITNAIKYAFHPREASPQPGLIRVELSHIENELELIIEDNGNGSPEKLTGTGFGHQMVNSMTRQLKAKYSLTSTSGYRHSFIIPLT